MHPDPGKIAQRIEGRRRRPPEGPLNVATSPDDPRSLRYFAFGELWRVEPHGWENLRGWTDSEKRHPGLVLSSVTAAPDKSVSMAPGTSQRKSEHPHIFAPWDNYEVLYDRWKQGYFFVGETMRRDVRARYILERKARLSDSDRERLKAQLAEL